MTLSASPSSIPPPGDHSPSGEIPRPSRWSETTLFSVLILLSVLPYSNSLLNAFVYDDTTQILDNPYIVSFRHLGQVFTTAVWSYVGGQELTNYYRPVMTFGYMVCFYLFGATPYGFHLANILLHAAVVCMIYVLTRRIFESRAVAFVAAVVFALHPIHTESVDWVAAVTDVEVTLFFLLTFWFFLRVPGGEGKRSGWAVVGMGVSFCLALCSKEQALMLPFLATVYEHFYRQDRRTTNRLRKVSRYYVLWVLLFAYLLFRIHLFGAFAPVIGHPEVTRSAALLSGVALLGQYIWKLLWPVNLCAFYVFHASGSLLDGRFLAGAAMLAACGGLFVFLWKRHRAASFGIVWFFATLAPVLNARVLASDNVFAERYLYLPSVGFCWLAALGLKKVWDGLSSRPAGWRWACASALAVLAALCAARIVTRNRIWRNEITFYSATLEASPDAVPIYNNLGSVYWNRGDVEMARRQWHKALALVPDSPTLLNNLGLVYMEREEFPKALDYFKKSADEKPDFPDPHLNLGVTYQKMGLKAEAEVQYRTAMSLAPLNLHIHNRLGSLLLDEGRIQEAREQFSRSASIAPNVVAYDALGEIQLQRGSPAAAERMFSRSLALNSRDAGARAHLAEIFVAAGRPAKAIEEYRAILKFDPQNAAAREALSKLTAPVSAKTHDAKN